MVSKIISNSRIKLWAHIVSMHACAMDLNWTMDEYLDFHEHEHNNGPGGIRNHPEDSREYSLKKMGQVLSELDE